MTKASRAAAGSAAVNIRVKRIYDPPSPADGARFLVDRLWPRGIKKEAARLDGWLRDLAPSDALRKAFCHVPEKWDAFRRSYREELAARPDACAPSLDAARKGPVTLLYAAKDSKYNTAVALLEYLTCPGKV